MTVEAYSQGLLDLTDGTTDWATANVYAILVDNTYTFSAAHTQYSDVSAAEITDTDYAPQDVASKTVALDTGDVLYDSADISFGANVSIDASGGRIIFLVGDEATPGTTDRLLFTWQLPNPAQSTNAEFTVTTGNGIYRIEPQQV